jgi:hypothetical protein
MVVHVVATIPAASASIAFTAFLLSRKPAERTILHRQLVMVFLLKLVSYPYYSGQVYFWYRARSQLASQVEDWENWELGLMGTLFSFSTARILSILSIVMYTLVSASRMLLFVSPAKFNNLNKKLVLYSSILVVVLVFVFETVMSQVVFSPARCDVDVWGHLIHSSASNIATDLNLTSSKWSHYTLSESTQENNVNKTSLELSVKTCTLFPSLIIWTVIFLLLEVIRFTFAVSRKYKMIKRVKIVPMQSNAVQSIGLQPRRIIKEDVHIKHTGSVPRANVMKNTRQRRLSLQTLPCSIIEYSGLNEPGSSKPPDRGPNVSKDIDVNRLSTQILLGCDIESPGLNEPEQSRHTDKVTNAYIPKNINERRLVIEVMPENNALPHGNNKQGPSRHSGSVPKFNVPKNIEERRLTLQSFTPTNIEERRLSLQILPPFNAIDSPELNEAELVVVNTNQDHTAQTLTDAEKMKDYVSFLFLRTYTLVIVTMFFGLVYLSLPIHMEIRIEFVSIDVYFVPVFWILYEKEAWSYTVKNVKKMYLSVLLRFYRE